MKQRDSGEFIIEERLTVQQREQLLELLEEYKDLLREWEGQTSSVIKSDCLQNEVDRQIADLLEQGMIEESDSSYAASIVCVKKRNGEIRLTCDYRSIN